MTVYRDRGATGYYMELRGKPTISVRAGAVPVPKDTPAQRIKLQAIRSLSYFQWKRTRRRIAIMMALEKRKQER